MKKLTELLGIVRALVKELFIRAATGLLIEFLKMIEHAAKKSAQPAHQAKLTKLNPTKPIDMGHLTVDYKININTEQPPVLREDVRAAFNQATKNRRGTW